MVMEKSCVRTCTNINGSASTKLPKLVFLPSLRIPPVSVDPKGKLLALIATVATKASPPTEKKRQQQPQKNQPAPAKLPFEASSACRIHDIQMYYGGGGGYCH
ncbi:hypothetical protein AAC387_Pa05g0006 [Persea americana]